MKKFIYEKLATDLKNKIRANVWRSGEKLPSIRKLCDEYRVSKISVQSALHKLEAAGLIHAKPKSGYFVSVKVEIRQTDNLLSQPRLIEVPSIFHEIMAKGAAFDIFPSEKVKAQSNAIALLNRHINRAMRSNALKNSLYYDNPEGCSELKHQISEHYRTRNLYVKADEICITSGCQNSLFLALSTCCSAGDTVVIESPAFYGCLQLLQQLKLKVIEIPASENYGIQQQQLETILTQWKIAACIVTPNYSTPTGSSLPIEKKQLLIDLAYKHNFMLIEDDIYGDLGFHLIAEPLKTLDRHGHVILCSSLSKVLSRDLRVGWIIGGKKHKDIVQLKLVSSLATNQALQQGVASFMAEGFYRRHLIQYRLLLKKQRDLLIKTIEDNWNFPFDYSLPHGGLSLWIRLEKPIDTALIYEQAITDDIIITPGMLFSSHNSYAHCMRLSFVHAFTEKRQLALKKIGYLIQAAYSRTNIAFKGD